MVFLLPQESGERVSFSVTVLLSFAVFLTVIGDNIPKTSSPMPFVCYYVVIVLITSGLITCSVILCQRLHHVYGCTPIPRWFLICLCISSTNPGNTSFVFVAPLNGESKTSDLIKYSTEEEIITWKQVITRLDKIFFVFFFLTTVCISLGFMLSMSTTNK